MAWAQIPGKADRAGDIDSAGAAETEPFLAQKLENDGERFGVRDLVGLVDLGSLQIGGDTTLADPLGDRAALPLSTPCLY